MFDSNKSSVVRTSFIGALIHSDAFVIILPAQDVFVEIRHQMTVCECILHENPRNRDERLEDVKKRGSLPHHILRGSLMLSAIPVSPLYAVSKPSAGSDTDVSSVFICCCLFQPSVRLCQSYAPVSL